MPEGCRTEPTFRLRDGTQHLQAMMSATGSMAPPALLAKRFSERLIARRAAAAACRSVHTRARRRARDGTTDVMGPRHPAGRHDRRTMRKQPAGSAGVRSRQSLCFMPIFANSARAGETA